MYRSVDELNQNELEELRSRIYHQLFDEGSLNEIFGEDFDSEDEIPMDFVKDYYRETIFVEEDFWCNLTE